MNNDGKKFIEKICKHLADIGHADCHKMLYLIPDCKENESNKHLVSFGFQGFCKEYLLDKFCNYFFEEGWQELLKELQVLNDYLNIDDSIVDRLKNLHDLCYIPLKITALSEGAGCKVGEPIAKVECTLNGFEWLVDSMGEMLADELLYPIKVASLGCDYRNIIQKYYEKTSEASIDGAFSGFGFKEPHGDVQLYSAALLASFTHTSDVHGISYCKEYYNLGKDGSSYEKVAPYVKSGSIEELLEILTTTYPKGSIHIELASRNLWDEVNKFKDSRVKDAILNREGTVYLVVSRYDTESVLCGCGAQAIVGTDLLYLQDYCLKHGNGFYPCKIENTGIDEYYSILVIDGSIEDMSRVEMRDADLGLLEILWNTYGGTVNSKGFKVLDSHIRIGYISDYIYWEEDYIPKMCTFSADNVVFSVGGYINGCRYSSYEL